MNICKMMTILQLFIFSSILSILAKTYDKNELDGVM